MGSQSLSDQLGPGWQLVAAGEDPSGADTWQVQRSPDLQLDARAELAGTLRLLLERLDDGHRISLP